MNKGYHFVYVVLFCIMYAGQYRSNPLIETNFLSSNKRSKVKKSVPLENKLFKRQPFQGTDRTTQLNSSFLIRPFVPWVSSAVAIKVR